MSTDRAEAEEWVHRHLAGWPLAVRKLAGELIVHYGKPREATARRLAWFDNAPWKRTVLYRTGVKHNFPLPHEDLLEQTVSYRVPIAKIAALVKYNGSLVVDRTRGELSAHCNSEMQNRIVLNLADDIVTGQRSVDEALGYHAQIIRGMQDHVSESYALKLKFKILPSSATEDPGKEAELLAHLGES